MKVTEKDLDNAIVSKLNQLENIKKDANSNLPDGYVAYGKDGFYIKRIPEIQLRTVCSNIDIANLRDAIDHPTRFDLSSKYVDIRESGKHHLSEIPFKREFLPSDLTSVDLGSAALKAKTLFGDLYILLKNGNIVEFTSNKEIAHTYPVLERICTSFNLHSKLFVNDIVDFDMLGCVIFVATRSNGIYTYNTDTEEVVLFISENKIRTMDLAKTDALFVTTDTECIFYDIINGAVIERYKTLYNRYQVPLFTKVTGDYIFVIGETYNAAPTDQYLHAWKLDKSGLSYNQIDGALPKNRRALGGMVSCYSSVYDDIYFVLKSFEGNSIIHYNDKLELEEKPFGFSTDNLIQVNSDEYLFVSGNSVYHVCDNLTEQIEFNMGSAEFLGILYGTFYVISGNTIHFFTLGKLDSSSTTLRYKVFDSTETCNNIEILIDGDNLKDINLLDDADIPIRPSYKTTVNSMTYIKLINCKVNKVFISVSVDSASLIRGIVCRSNKLYLR